MIGDDFLFLPRNSEEAYGEWVLATLLRDQDLWNRFEASPSSVVPQLRDSMLKDADCGLEGDPDMIARAVRTISVELKMLRSPGGFDRYLKAATETGWQPGNSEALLGQADAARLFRRESAEPDRVCPSTMCPLFAANGSPWSGAHNHPCRKSDCVWWQSQGGAGCDAMATAMDTLEELQRSGAVVQAGPIRAKRVTKASPKTFDCPRAGDCQWQLQAEADGKALCPPRLALAKGLDPKACAF